MPLIRRSLPGTRTFGRRGSRDKENTRTSKPQERELDCGCKPLYYVRPAIGDVVLCRFHQGYRTVIR